MKTFKNILLTTLAIVMAALTSCDNPSYPGGETKDAGKVSLAKISLSVLNVQNVIESRSSVDVGTFTVNIKNEAGELQKSFIYAEMPEIIELAAGKYTIEAYNAELQDAAFDAPYFYGSGEFEVKANDITEVDPIVCKLANIKVSVNYSDALKKMLGDDVKVTVTVAQNEVLVFTKDETRAGYFKYVEGNTTIEAQFTGTVDGYEISGYKVLDNAVAPGNHHIITFDIKDAPEPPEITGQIGNTNFTMDATVKRIDLTRSINPGDEDIIEPDEYLTVERNTVALGCEASSKNISVKSSGVFTVESDADWCTISNLVTSGDNKGFTINATANTDASNDRSAIVTVTMGSQYSKIQVTQAKYTEKSTAPTFSSENIEYLDNDNLNYNDASNTEFNNVNDFGPTAKAAVVKFVAEKGIKTLHVEINSETLTPEELESVGLRSKFELTTGLADDGTDVSTNLSNLGFPLKDGVINKTEVNFDITQFVPMLKALGAGKSVFVVVITDNENQSNTAYIRFQATK